jgi:hypothetical protein
MAWWRSSLAQRLATWREQSHGGVVEISPAWHRATWQGKGQGRDGGLAGGRRPGEVEGKGAEG